MPISIDSVRKIFVVLTEVNSVLRFTSGCFSKMSTHVERQKNRKNKQLHRFSLFSSLSRSVALWVCMLLFSCDVCKCVRVSWCSHNLERERDTNTKRCRYTARAAVSRNWYRANANKNTYHTNNSAANG